MYEEVGTIFEELKEDRGRVETGAASLAIAFAFASLSTYHLAAYVVWPLFLECIYLGGVLFTAFVCRFSRHSHASISPKCPSTSPRNYAGPHNTVRLSHPSVLVILIPLCFFIRSGPGPGLIWC